MKERRITETMSEYRKHRNMSIAWALAHVNGNGFTWKDFSDWVADYEDMKQVRIITPINYGTGMNGFERPNGGWDFNWYPRINVALNNLVAEGLISYNLVKNTRHYYVR